MASFLKNKTMSRTPVITLGFLLLGINVVCAAQIIRLSSRQAHIKEDFAYVNSLRFGLFSMDIWKEHFERIVSKSITDLQLTAKDETTLKKQVEKVVKVMITQADSILIKNKKGVSKAAYKALVDVPTLMKKSPQFAEAVVNEITKPQSLEQIRILALSQLNRYASETRNNDTQGPSLPQVLALYNSESIRGFNATVGPLIQSLQRQIRLWIVCMIGSVGVFLFLGWLLRDQPHLHRSLYAIASILGILVLLTSLSVPMIDIDARIKTVDLLLLGERIQFNDQILFYRSKSILQVVQILMTSGKGDTMIVGFLLFLFSIIFPLAKLIATIMCLSKKESYRRNKWVQFFAFRSGKWSMADVMVLAIFMAYIGFNSLLNNQLKGLNVSSTSWQMITTHETSLQPGFILFVTFVLFGLALSEILKVVISEDQEWA
jgi:hypothetical protein